MSLPEASGLGVREWPYMRKKIRLYDKKYQYSILLSHFKIWLDSYSQEALFYFSETQGEHMDKKELLLY